MGEERWNWQTAIDVHRYPDPLHLFILANILKRPIIVVKGRDDADGAFSFCVGARDVDYSGVYLPLLWDASLCVKSPLVFAFHRGQFLPLIGRENEEFVSEEAARNCLPAVRAVPLVTSDLVPLPVLFLLAEEEKAAFDLQKKYMELTEISLTSSNAVSAVLSARLQYEGLDEGADVQSICLRNNTAPNGKILPGSCVTSAAASVDREAGRANCHGDSQFQNPSCPVEGCGHYGQWEYDWMCSRCFVHHGRPAVVAPSDPEVCLSDPSAPPASIISRTLPGGVIHLPYHAYQEEPSIVYELCQHLNCSNFVSKYTRPFCYEHVEASESSKSAQREDDMTSQAAVRRGDWTRARAPHERSHAIREPYGKLKTLSTSSWHLMLLIFIAFMKISLVVLLYTCKVAKLIFCNKM